MFKETSKFQLILIGFFAFATVAGLLTFSLFKGKQGSDVKTVTVWGTVDKSLFSPFAQHVMSASKQTVRLSYKQIDEDAFDDQLVEAIATSKGPDIILVNQKSLLKQENKLVSIPYDSLPEATFKSTFIQEGELFLGPKGVEAVPFSIDPLVLYWNRNLFTNANLSLPPKYWEQFISIVPQLTKRDDAGNITQSAVALGEYANIVHAKDVLSLLMLQAGNPLVVRAASGYQTTIASSFNNTVLPSDSALTFYTQFADPRKSAYSWNRSLKDSKTQFLAEKLSMYFGYASEMSEIRDKNPYLNFDVATVPQPQPKDGAKLVNMTMGNMYGFAILRSSKNQASAFAAITAMTNKDSATFWTRITDLPSVRRDAVVSDSSNAASTVFASSALIARGWLDPDQVATEQIFKDLIESVTSGRSLYSEAINDASNKINDLLTVINKRK